VISRAFLLPLICHDVAASSECCNPLRQPEFQKPRKPEISTLGGNIASSPHNPSNNYP
jgi:hypothetical protein